MTRSSIQILVLLTSLTAWGAALPAEPVEPQPSVQIMPSVLAIPTALGKPAWLTPEKEAALVEVRKILQEAQEVAEGIRIPSRLFTERHRVKDLERVKAQLLDEIERAQFRAGDFQAADSTKHLDLLAVAQATHGQTEDAVRTAARPGWANGVLLLTLVDRLLDSGNASAAKKAVDARLGKGVTNWNPAQRARYRAEALALVAQWQQERSDPTARATLQQALEAARDVIDPRESYWAFLSVGRAQGLLGDQAGSTESFGQALKAAQGQRDEERPLLKLMWMAKAQAEAGNAAASQHLFQQAIQARRGYLDLLCLAWVQSTMGNHPAALQSLQQAVTDAGTLSSVDRQKALSTIADWQGQLGARDAVGATIDQLRQSGALVNARQLATRWGFFERALAIDAEMTNTDAERASFLSHLVRRLVATGDPMGTPEKLQQFSEEVTRLRNRLPNDQSKANWMLVDSAVIQAAVGDLTGVRQAIEMMPDIGPLNLVYTWIAEVLVRKGELTAAAQLISDMREWNRPFAPAFRFAGKAYGQSGEIAAGLTWARQQQNVYAKSWVLLGVAEGLLKSYGVKAQGFGDDVHSHRCPNSFDEDGNPL